MLYFEFFSCIYNHIANLLPRNKLTFFDFELEVRFKTGAWAEQMKPAMADAFLGKNIE